MCGQATSPALRPAWLPHALPRVHQLLCDIVEEVPATEGEGALEEGQGQVAHGGRHPESKGVAGRQLLKVSWWGVEDEKFRSLGSARCSLSPANPAHIPSGPALGDLDEAHADDEGQGQQLPSCEHVLDACGPAHTGTVDPRQEHW